MCHSPLSVPLRLPPPAVPPQLAQVEKEVDKQHLNQLMSKCQNEKRQRQRLLQEARCERNNAWPFDDRYALIDYILYDVCVAVGI